MAIAGALVACSSAGDADPAPTTDPSTTVAVSEPEATTTTAAPTTTVAPTTTLDPAESLAAEVEADLLEAFRLGRVAFQDPFDEAKEQAAKERRLGLIAQRFADSLAEYREKNYALRPNEQTPASVVVEGLPVFLGSDGEVAEVQVCEVNSWILVEVGAGPNGTDAVVDPSILATRAKIFMREVDGTWLFEGSRSIAEWEGAPACLDE